MKTKITSASLPAIVMASLAAIGASVCCVLPLAFVLLGVSGAWISNLTAFDPWRPWFSAATLLCLGLAFWNLYRPSSRCRTDGECVDPKVLHRRKRLLWIVTLCLLLLLLFPYYIGWFL